MADNTDQKTGGLPAHADGTANIDTTPTVPSGPIDHRDDHEQLDANQQARVRAILTRIAEANAGHPDFALLAGKSPELASLGLTAEQAERAAERYVRKLAPNTTRIQGTKKSYERES